MSSLPSSNGFDQEAKELDPNSSGVSNQDVGWLARGNSLRSSEQGKRTRNRSTSLPPSSRPPHSLDNHPSLPPIESESPRSASPVSNNSSSNNRVSDDAKIISSQDYEPSPQTAHSHPIQRKPSWFQSISSKFHSNNSSELPTFNAEPGRASSPKINTDNVIPEHQQMQQGRRGSETNSTQKGSLITRLRRLSRSSQSNLNSPTATPSASQSSVETNNRRSTERIVLNKNPEKKHCKLSELEGVLPKRVMFCQEVFDTEPPQQIPSRNPKHGNIEIGANGQVSRRTDLATVLGASSPQNHYPIPKNYAVTAQQASITAHESAVRIANALKANPGNLPQSKLSKFLPGSTSLATSSIPEDEDAIISGDDDEELDDGKKKFDLNTAEVDKPMTPKGGFECTKPQNGDDKKPQQHRLEDIYTRCCHLREILPIPATLKQVKDRTAPMDMIRLMNPKPTLIEILSFSDFLSIVPINCIVLDNCSLTTEMLEILFCSLRTADSLYKLSLRNVIMEGEGWKYFCSFLSENTSIGRLDLSIQTDAKHCKLKSDANRSKVDWKLFTRTLQARDGIQELLLNGCMIPEAELDSMILEALENTRKLGLAANGLQSGDLKVLIQWASGAKTVCEGIDLGGNDLSNCCGQLIEFVSEAQEIMFLSLSSTNLSYGKDTEELLTALSKLPTLRYLDMSFNPHLFPELTMGLSKQLPQFKDLRRLHLDSCDLKSESIIQLSESFSLCPRLVYLSVLHNRDIDSTAIAALAMSVDMSSTIYTLEVDSDLVQPSVKKRLAHFCLVNMENIVTGKSCKPKEGEKEMRLDEKELYESGNELAKAVGEILQSSGYDPDELHCSKVTDAMVKRAQTIRRWVQNSLEKLLSKKDAEGGLDSQSKESVIRLIFLDGNLEKVLDMYDKSMERRVTDRSSVGKMHAKTHEVFSHGVLGEQADNSELKIAPIEDNMETVSRRPSSTSLQAKAQIQEEGEIHKLGTFMSKHKSDENLHNAVEAASQLSAPSGETLREAILAAKGNQSIHTLIDKVKQAHRSELEKILGDLELLEGSSTNKAKIEANTDKDKDTNEEVDEKVLDTVINDLTRVLTKSKHISEENDDDDDTQN